MLKVPRVVSTEATNRWVELVPMSMAATRRVWADDLVGCDPAGAFDSDTASSIVGPVQESIHFATDGRSRQALTRVLQIFGLRGQHS